MFEKFSSPDEPLLSPAAGLVSEPTSGPASEATLALMQAEVMSVAATGTSWRLEAPARASLLRWVRRLLQQWLRTVRWPAAQTTAIVTAVNEAVSNCVQHAYRSAPPGGQVWVQAQLLPTLHLCRIESS